MAFYGAYGDDEGGDANDVLSQLDLAALACREGRITYVRQLVDKARDLITNTMDLKHRPAVWRRLGEVLGQVIVLERSR